MTDQVAVLLWPLGSRWLSCLATGRGGCATKRTSQSPMPTTVLGRVSAPGLLLAQVGSGVRMTDWMMLQKRKDEPEYLAYLGRTPGIFMRLPRRNDPAQDVR